MIRCLGILLWIVGLAFAETEFSPDSVITTFPDKISIQFLARYNYAAFSGASTDDEQMQTNCPIDLGLGGRVWRSYLEHFVHVFIRHR